MTSLQVFLPDWTNPSPAASRVICASGSHRSKILAPWVKPCVELASVSCRSTLSGITGSSRDWRTIGYVSSLCRLATVARSIEPDPGVDSAL